MTDRGDVLLHSFSELTLTLFFVAAFIVILEGLLYYVLVRRLRARHALPIMLLAPAIIGLSLLIFYPVVYNIYLAFSNMSLRTFTPERGMTVGFAEFFENIKLLFTAPVLKRQGFFSVLLRTLLWTGIQVTAHSSLGLSIAILLNRPMKLRGIYRTIILIPWAIPQVIAVMAFRGEFNYEYGYINNILQVMGFDRIKWMSDPIWNFIAINITNIWLGVPFMAVVLLGGLQSINREYYEVAEIDGAGKLSCFRYITIPLLKPILTPAVILGIIWTFNNFNVSYFINQQELETSDILVTALFRAAFEYNRYGFASAFAIVIFLILISLTILYLRISKVDAQFAGNKINRRPV